MGNCNSCGCTDKEGEVSTYEISVDHGKKKEITKKGNGQYSANDVLTLFQFKAFI